MLRSPMRLFGGKGNMVKKLLPLIPEHHCYCEPFGGAGQLLFAKRISTIEVFNDIDGDLIRMFRVFQSPKDFKVFNDMCRKTLYSRALYYEYLDTWQEQSDAVEKAYRWFVVARMSFRGSIETRTWGYSPTRSESSKFKFSVDNFEAVVERLRSVTIDNRCWTKVVKSYDTPQTFFYLDPPYVKSERSSRGYMYEMSDEDHMCLIETIQSLNGKVLLSGYKNPIYESLEWQQKEFDTYSHFSTADSDSKKRTECLWYNYDLPTQQELF